MIQIKAPGLRRCLWFTMPKLDLLEKHGLFSARVPRYTSYPPANRFQDNLGQRFQADWLRAVPQGAEVSAYIHIPFCKRLCWFCACRTQGTSSLRPVDAYIDVLLQEIDAARQLVAPNLRLSRLHIGGGTPTILTPALMTRLVTAMTDAFPFAPDHEFSVEIDPTSTAEGILSTLADLGLNRASIGIQDFAPAVQDAIGRHQSFEETHTVVEELRGHGVDSVNFDLLYGLPHQTRASLTSTLAQVQSLGPDRVALYGYAHVPWMSKRQVVIDSDSLPDAPERFQMAELARTRMESSGFTTIGIDHFARPSDGLARAQRKGTLTRNFQGYTDDQSTTLIGFGASAISRFEQGYVHNAVSTLAYSERIKAGGLAGFKGAALTDTDKLIGAMVEGLMCYGAFDPVALSARYPDAHVEIDALCTDLLRDYGDVLHRVDDRLVLDPDYMALSRVIAARVDDFTPEGAQHSLAI